MGDRFVALQDFLLPALVSEPLESFDEQLIAPQRDEAPHELREAVGEARRFSAAVRDAADVSVRSLLCDIAAEVLARELQLAPANLQAIVAAAYARHENEGVLVARVHPDEVGALAGSALEVVADCALRRGDAVLQVRSGTIDVSLGARLADVLDGLTP